MPLSRTASLPQGTAEPEVLRRQLAAAVRGLQQLEAYAGLESTTDDWELWLKGSCD